MKLSKASVDSETGATYFVRMSGEHVLYLSKGGLTGKRGNVKEIDDERKRMVAYDLAWLEKYNYFLGLGFSQIQAAQNATDALKGVAF